MIVIRYVVANRIMVTKLAYLQVQQTISQQFITVMSVIVGYKSVYLRAFAIHTKSISERTRSLKPRLARGAQGPGPVPKFFNLTQRKGILGRKDNRYIVSFNKLISKKMAIL